MQIHDADPAQLQQWLEQLQNDYESLKQRNLGLDLTRGKPSAEQLSLANGLDAILDGNFSEGSIDLRNYGGLYGIPSARRLGAEILGLSEEQVLVGGNSSLQLMYQCVMFAWLFGPHTDEPWQGQQAKFICPVPGYDRHFSICEELGIEMITVPMLNDGPDMNAVEDLVRNDTSIKGIWCVPKYSNPTGATYSQDVVERLAQLGTIASAGFRVFWDNAYAVHDLTGKPPHLSNIMELAEEHGCADNIYLFASTSKITFAGSGISWVGMSGDNLATFVKHLGMSTIGNDKLNQARHSAFLPDLNAVKAHMQKHAQSIKPKFDCVLNTLKTQLSEEFGSWTTPQGGYFISFDTQPGLASRVIELANDAGIKLTPAGSTFPYKKDPDDKNIRIAPTVPTLDEVQQAINGFALCVKLATLEQRIK